MITDSQRTVYALDLELNMRLGTEYTVRTNTTLNEKFNIRPNEPLPSGVYPKLKYLAIGVGGANIIAGNEYRYSAHRATDAALFEHIPFVIRPIDNDLSDQEKLKYRLRKIENINSTEYICYYLKVVEPTNFTNGLYEIIVSGTDTNLLFFDTSKYDLLNPTPRAPGDLFDITNNKYVARTVKFPFILDEDETNELRNALAIKYIEDRLPTELALCSGYDVAEGALYEATNVQVNYFIGIDINTEIEFANATTIVRALEIGGMEPMLSS